jgi:hypothetical protein
MNLLPLILAESSAPSDHDFVVWATIAALVIGFAWVIVQIIQSFRRTPPIDAQFATKQELAELRKDFTDSLSELERKLDHNAEKIDTDLNRHNQQAEERARKIHGRVDQVLAGISKIQGRCEAFHGAGAYALQEGA